MLIQPRIRGIFLPGLREAIKWMEIQDQALAMVAPRLSQHLVLLNAKN